MALPSQRLKGRQRHFFCGEGVPTGSQDRWSVSRRQIVTEGPVPPRPHALVPPLPGPVKRPPAALVVQNASGAMWRSFHVPERSDPAGP